MSGGLQTCHKCGTKFISTITENTCWVCAEATRCGCHCTCTQPVEASQRKGDRCADCMTGDHTWGATQ